MESNIGVALMRDGYMQAICHETGRGWMQDFLVEIEFLSNK